MSFRYEPAFKPLHSTPHARNPEPGRCTFTPKPGTLQSSLHTTPSSLHATPELERTWYGGSTKAKPVLDLPRQGGVLATPSGGRNVTLVIYIIYTYMYIYIYVYITYTCMYIYIYIYVCICMPPYHASGLETSTSDEIFTFDVFTS